MGLQISSNAHPVVKRHDEWRGIMNINEMRADIAHRGKKGLHFILASIIIWGGVFIIWTIPIENVLTRNFLTFCVTAPLMPIAYLISKLIRAEFSSVGNPLNYLGLLFSLNQYLYLLIAMWVYPTVPEKMVMVIAMIFGAHLLPYGWLYQSRAYTVMAVLISLGALIIGNLASPAVLAAVMAGVEVIFSAWLAMELRLGLQQQKA